MQADEPGGVRRVLRVAGRYLLRVPLPLAMLLVLLWGLLIWDLSSHAVPLPQGARLIWEFLSNLAHAPLFGFLTLFTAAVLLRERDGGWPRPRSGRSLLVLVCVLAYGALDELHQSHTPGRDASPFDVLTDFVSALAVLWIVFILERRELKERELVLRLLAGGLACCTSAALALFS